MNVGALILSVRENAYDNANADVRESPEGGSMLAGESPWISEV